AQPQQGVLAPELAASHEAEQEQQGEGGEGGDQDAAADAHGVDVVDRRRVAVGVAREHRQRRELADDAVTPWASASAGGRGATGRRERGAWASSTTKSRR